MAVPATDWKAGMRITANRLLARNDQWRTELISFASAASYTQVITFDEAFPSVPAVMVSLNSPSGVAGKWTARAYNISATGFTLFILKTDAAEPNQAWTDQRVDWHATV